MCREKNEKKKKFRILESSGFAWRTRATLLSFDDVFTFFVHSFAHSSPFFLYPAAAAAAVECCLVSFQFKLEFFRSMNEMSWACAHINAMLWLLCTANTYSDARIIRRFSRFSFSLFVSPVCRLNTWARTLKNPHRRKIATTAICV